MKVVKSVIKYLFLTALLLLAALSLYTYLYADEIVAKATSALNKNLTQEVKVNSVDFSLIENFPKASLIFNNAQIVNNSETLLNAKEIRVKFDLLPLLSRQFQLSAISFSSATINLIRAPNGEFNYKFWKESDHSTEGLSIKLDQLQFYDTELHYADLAEEGDYHFSLNELLLKIERLDSSFKAYSEADLIINSLPQEELSSFLNQPLSFNSLITFTQKEGLSIISEEFATQGLNASLQLYKAQETYELDVNLSKQSIGKLIHLFPENLRSELASTTINGAISGDGKVRFGNALELNYAASIEEGFFQTDSMELPLEAISVQLEGNLKQLKFDELTFNWKDIAIDGKGRVFGNSFENYETVFELNPNYKQLNKLYSVENLRFTAGSLPLHIKLKGKVSDLAGFNGETWKRNPNELKAEMRDLAFQYEQHLLENFNGSITIKSNSLEANNIKGKQNGHGFELALVLNNLINYLDHNDRLFIDADLKTEQINLDEWIDSSKTSDNPNLQVYLNFSADRFYYSDFSAQNANGLILYKDYKIQLKNIAFQACGGEIEGDGIYNLIEKNSSLALQGKAKSINIEALFKSFNNFNQEVIKSTQLSGTLSGSFNFQGSFDDKNELISKSVILHTDLIIDKGRLRNFEPIYKLAKYIELDELKDIKFNRLENQFLIKDNQIKIPNFMVKSSAIDLQIEGTHNFDNQVDYKIVVWLDKVLGKKVKKPEIENYGYVEDDGLGKTKLFLTLNGNLDDPQIKYDPTQLKQHWKSEIQKEKQTVKSILNKEFGLFSKDSTLKPLKPKTTTSDPFQVEWEEAKEQPTQSDTTELNEKKSSKKGKFGKFLDKIAKPNENEYVEPPKD